MKIAADRFQNPTNAIPKLSRDPSVRAILGIHYDDVSVQQLGPAVPERTGLVELDKVVDRQLVLAGQDAVLDAHGSINYHFVAERKVVTAFRI
ncbi:hypothetical protein [Sphingomonas sp.]|uniref:hypothetical protein n=1 Tax=Sphingomonas sp. TaxID=28214 RepID=UPI002EDB0FDF